MHEITSLLLCSEDDDSTEVSEVTLWDYECFEICTTFFAGYLKIDNENQEDMRLRFVAPLRILRERGPLNRVGTLLYHNQQPFHEPVYRFYYQDQWFLQWNVYVHRWHTTYDWQWRKLFPTVSKDGFSEIVSWFQMIAILEKKFDVPSDLMNTVLQFV